MRISDWSSDVCSSDLSCRYANRRQAAARLCAPPALRPYGYCPVVAQHPVPPRAATTTMPRVAAAASFGSCGNVRFGMRATRQMLQHTIQFGNPGFCVTRLAAADQGDQITRELHEIAVCLVQFGVAWSTLEPCNPAKQDRKSVVEGKSVSVRVDLGG